MGALYVSASEIETFDLCKRKWAFVYIEGKRPPPNDSAALGSRVHSILERWLKDGTAPDTWTVEGEIAASGLHLLPMPKFPGLVTEQGFHFTSRRAWYTGFKDFRYRDANGLIHVGDHKTTKSFTWAKSLEQILCHPQALIYAVDEFRNNPDDHTISLDWVYYKTQGSRKAEPRFQIVSREQVAELFFTHVDEVAGEITSLHHGTPPGTPGTEFEPNFRACDAYGGCAFLSICNPTPIQRVQANMTQAALSLQDRLRALAAQRGQSPLHPPEAQQAPVPYVPPQASQAPQAPGFAPPMYAPPPAPPQTPQAPALAQAMSARFDLPIPTPTAAPQALQAAQPSAAPAFIPPQAPAAPKQRRTKTKAEVIDEMDDTPEGRMNVALATEAAEAEAVQRYEAPATSASDGFTLYIGCAPLGVDLTNALDYCNLAHDMVRESHKVPHYRAIGYGEGPGTLCNALESVFVQCAQTGTQPAGDVFLGDSLIEQDTSNVWLSKASKIVRGFR